MKKLLGIGTVALLLMSHAAAQMSFGVRGSLGASILSITESEERELGEELAGTLFEVTGTDAVYSVSNDNVTTGGFSVRGNYSFPSLPALGIQLEFGTLFNNGTEINGESKSGIFKMEVTDKLTYTTLELPLLVTYTVNKGGRVEFIPQAGLYLSFPIDKCNQDADIDASMGGSTLDPESVASRDSIDSRCIVGAAFGADLAFNITQSSGLLLNLRYMYDFTKLKVDGDEVARRSVVLVSAGYRYTVN